MPRSLDQILAEVTAKSDPQRQTVLNQIASLPTQQAADESALGAQKDQSYEDIVSGARRRGLGFAGIPLGEQAKYNATTYAPAVANLKTSYGNRKGTLESALADIGRADYGTAQDIFGRDQAFEEQQRQFNENLGFQKQQAAAQAASSSALASLYNKPKTQPQPQPTPTTPRPTIQKNQNGYQFFDAYGSPISAVEYVQLANVTGQQIGFRQLLTQMANDGDANARIALNYVGDDGRFGSAPSSVAGSLSALGAIGTYQQAAAAPRSNAVPNVTPQSLVNGSFRR
jgi:hypothetical protein